MSRPLEEKSLLDSGVGDLKLPSSFSTEKARPDLQAATSAADSLRIRLIDESIN